MVKYIKQTKLVLLFIKFKVGVYMSIYEIKDTKFIEKLFSGWEETLIWSVLQGCMGRAYVDNIENPKSAQLVIADFCFLAGEANEELLCNKPKDYKGDFIIMIPQNESISKAIEDKYKEDAKKVYRYAIKKEKDIFDIKKLENIVEKASKSFEVKLIDEEIYNEVTGNEWSKDLCSQFINYDEYKNRGIGVAVLDNGVVVSGASSYTVYNEGIEIQIDTRADYRRKGLALICGAKLILECINRGLYPSWDAQNKGSVALAEKLGYHFDKEYEAYEISNY